MKLFIRLFIGFLLFSTSCTDKEDVLETPKKEALKFLNNNSISISKGHSAFFESLRANNGFDGYVGGDIRHYFEIQNDYSFRFISEMSDCSYFNADESFTMIILSNLIFEDLYFTDVDSTRFTNRSFEDPLTSSIEEYYELILFVNKEVVNLNEFYLVPGLITSSSTTDLCNYNLENLIEPFPSTVSYLDTIVLTSDDQNELIKFQENVKILAEL